jgi:tRNA(fMet)-specific endonuclease VapC
VATYLLDTNTFSFLIERQPQVVARATSIAPSDRMVICAIVRGEILYGIERMPQGRRRRHVETTAANLFAQIPCENIPESAGDTYARIKRDAERKGTPLDENDLWIAATALAIGAALVTSDSDFQRVSGLTLEGWTT